MATTVAALRHRVLALAERRLPALTRLRAVEALPVVLHRRRIYVLPTAFGLGFALLLLVMLLGALNYGNNPALLLTCAVAGIIGASLFAGFRGVHGLRLLQVRTPEMHADSAVTLQLRFDAGSRARPSLRLRLGEHEHEQAFALPAQVSEVDLPWHAPARGWQRCGRLRLYTEYPLGLFNIWSWLNPEPVFLVYPALEAAPPPLPAGQGAFGDRALAGDNEELAGLREYRSNDPRRLIAWKASLRHEQLLVREVEHRSGVALTLDYASLHGLDHEARIRRLASWVVNADAQQASYALVLPETSLGPARGAQHRRECLRALALLPPAGGAP